MMQFEEIREEIGIIYKESEEKEKEKEKEQERKIRGEIEPDFDESVETMRIIAKYCRETRSDLTPMLLVYNGPKRAKRLTNFKRWQWSEKFPGNRRYYGGRTYNLINNEVSIATYSKNLPRNIPPHDSTACTPEKAYPLDKIIFRGTGSMCFPMDFLQSVQSGVELSPDVYPSFVCNRIHKLLEIEDKEEREKLDFVFSYMTYLIAFKDRQSLDDSSAEKQPMHIFYFRLFLAMFADDEKCNPSVEKRDLLISYVLVLALIVDGFCTDISDIARDLKIPCISLREYYLNLGCKVKQDDESVICTLFVPLEFPSSSMKRHM